jgi:hypothetical protein
MKSKTKISKALVNSIKIGAVIFLLSIVMFVYAQTIQDGDNIFKQPYYNDSSAGLDWHAGRGVWVADNPDLDQDGKPEILVTDYSDGGRVFVFEVADNDDIQLVWVSKILNPGQIGGNSTPRSVTTGDFDNDGQQEIIFQIGYFYSDSYEFATRGIYIYEYSGFDNDYGTEPIRIIKFEEIDPQFVNANVGATENGLLVQDIDGDGKRELLFPPRSFNFDVANLYILEVENGTFENGDAIVEVEYVYTNMARCLSGSSDGYVPVGAAVGNVDSDDLDEIVIAGWTNLGSGAGLGFLEISGPDTYTPGSILEVADFNAFIVKAKPLIIEVQNQPVIYLHGREDPSKIWIVNDIVSDQMVDQSNLKEVFDGVGVFSIWDWGDQDHGAGQDGFDIYLSTVNQIIDIEYDGSGDPANSSSYNIHTLSFDLDEFFDETSGLFDDVFTFPGMDLDRDGAREIVVSYKGSHLDILNGEPFVENTFNIFVFEYPIAGIAVDIKPQSWPNPLSTKSKGVLPVAILGTADFDVTTIDPVTVMLKGVAPLRWNIEDVRDTDYDCNTTTAGPDGYKDLTLKFDNQTIVTALGSVNDGETIVLTITGELFDNTQIEGFDCVLIKSKGKKHNQLVSDEATDIAMPIDYALFQNHPNPFNPTTTITFSLPEESDVSLKIYDMLGREVADLVSGRYSSGIHRISFDAQDLPSGVYVYKLNAGSFVAVKRMVIMK